MFKKLRDIVFWELVEFALFLTRSFMFSIPFGVYAWATKTHIEAGQLLLIGFVIDTVRIIWKISIKMIAKAQRDITLEHMGKMMEKSIKEQMEIGRKRHKTAYEEARFRSVSVPWPPPESVKQDEMDSDPSETPTEYYERLRKLGKTE